MSPMAVLLKAEKDWGLSPARSDTLKGRALRICEMLDIEWREDDDDSPAAPTPPAPRPPPPVALRASPVGGGGAVAAAPPLRRAPSGGDARAPAPAAAFASVGGVGAVFRARVAALEAAAAGGDVRAAEASLVGLGELGAAPAGLGTLDAIRASGVVGALRAIKRIKTYAAPAEETAAVRSQAAAHLIRWRWAAGEHIRIAKQKAAASSSAAALPVVDSTTNAPARDAEPSASAPAPQATSAPEAKGSDESESRMSHQGAVDERAAAAPPVRPTADSPDSRGERASDAEVSATEQHGLVRTVVRKYVSRPIRVRRAGTVEWRTFNTQTCAIREFPRLTKNVLATRLNARGFEARRLMSAADSRKLGWRKAIDIRRVGDRAWRRFESVKSAAKSEDFAVGIKALQDILIGRPSTSAKHYEVRYSEDQEVRTVEVRHNGGAWRASARNPTARTGSVPGPARMLQNSLPGAVKIELASHGSWTVRPRSPSSRRLERKYLESVARVSTQARLHSHGRARRVPVAHVEPPQRHS